MSGFLRWFVYAGLLLAMAGCDDGNIEDLLNASGGVGGGAYPIGNTGPIFSTQGEGTGLLFAQGPYNVGTPTNLVGLHVSIGSVISATQYRLGIYSDNGSGNPDVLVLSPPPQAVFPGLNSISIGPLPLPAGDYWLAAEYNGILNTNVSLGTADNRYGTHAFGSGWPANFPVVGPNTSNPTIIFMTVVD